MVAAVLLSTVMVPGRAAVEPSGFTPRFTGKGWLGLAHAEASVVGSDVDTDPSTVNSSRAPLTIPPHAVVQWAALHWAGDQATRADGSPARCAGSGEPAVPPVVPSSPVQLSIADSPYQTVSPGDLSRPPGRSGFQAYADVTGLLKPLGGKDSAVPVAIMVGGVPVATGPGCTGGWSIVVVYGYPSGPEPTYAPAYGSLAVFDPVLPSGAIAPLNGLLTPATGPVTAAVMSSLLAGGPPVGLAVNGGPLAGGAESAGYQVSTAALSPAAGSTTALLAVTGGPDSFAATVVSVAAGLPARVSLPVTAAFAPDHVAVGAASQLTVTVANNSDIASGGVQVTVPLPAGATLLGGDPAYDAATGVWKVGTLAAHGTATLNLNVRVNVPGSLTSSAKVTASSIEQTGPATAAKATVQADVVASVPSPPGDVTQDAGLNPGTGRDGLWQQSPGILIGSGVFGLGLLMFLIIVLRRRGA